MSLAIDQFGRSVVVMSAGRTIITMKIPNQGYLWYNVDTGMLDEGILIGSYSDYMLVRNRRTLMKQMGVDAERWSKQERVIIGGRYGPRQ